MADRQIFQLDNAALLLTDYIPSQIADGSIEARRTTPQNILNLTASQSARTPNLTDVFTTQISDGSTAAGKSSIADYQSLILGYKEYTGYFTQIGTSVPTVSVTNNTLGGTVVWTRTSAGIYIGTLAGAFTNSKTFIPTMNQQLPVANKTVFMIPSGLDFITVIVRLITDGSFADLNFSESMAISIKVYN